jgi:hypothetical protein
VLKTALRLPFPEKEKSWHGFSKAVCSVHDLTFVAASFQVSVKKLCGESASTCSQLVMAY